MPIRIYFEKQPGPGGSELGLLKDHSFVTCYLRIAAQTFAEPSVPGRHMKERMSDGN